MAVSKDSKFQSAAFAENAVQSFALAPPLNTVDLTFENIKFSVPISLFSSKKKAILKGVSGEFNSGELTAIMGPSGAGKSTLLNVLSGFLKDGITGEMYANGKILDPKKSVTKSHSSYIMQDDYFNPLFTVWEIMEYAAHLKLGGRTSYKSKLLLIEDILDSISMRETRNTLCQTLSGGQKKRLNVCLELISNPSILFLDEPTTGLDSASCNVLVNKLKGLARTGRTVICSIHQPSAGIFSMFDHVYIISAGKMVYQGDSNNILPFLDSVGLSCPYFHNPADFVMDVVCGEFGNYTDKLISASSNNCWRKSINYNNNHKVSVDSSKQINNSISERKPSEWSRYICLVPKIAKQLHRDWTISYLKLIFHFLVGILVGLIFQGFGSNGAKVVSNVSYFFVCILYLSFTSMMPAVLKFPTEIQVLKKEHFNNWYKFTTYFFALLTVHLPIQFVFSGAYAGISYLLTEQVLEFKRCCIFGIAIAFNTVISEFVGLFMGTMKDPVNGVFNGSIILAVLSLLSGFLVFLKDFPHYLYFVSYISFFRYSIEILVMSQYGMNRGKLDCPKETLYCHFRNPEMFTQDIMVLNEDNISRDVIMLVFYTLILGLITFFRLQYRLKNFH